MKITFKQKKPKINVTENNNLVFFNKFQNEIKKNSKSLNKKINVDVKYYENLDLNVLKNSLSNIFKKIIIITNKYVINEANLYSSIFFKNNMECEIIEILNEDIPCQIIEDVKNNNYIVFIIGFFQIKNYLKLLDIKNKVLIYQIDQQHLMEEKDGEIFFSRLIHFDNIIEFSNRNNFIHKNVDYMGPLIDTNFTKANKDIDILFFGSLINSGKYSNFSIRRNNIIKYLIETKKYKIKILSTTFGEELKELINKSKIVLNLHFNENSSLEIFRLNLALSCQSIIISENPTSNQEHYLYDLYKDLVNFVPLLKSNKDYDMLCKIVDQILKNNNNFNYKPKQLEQINKINKINESVLFKNLCKMKINDKINILIRNTYRPTYFKKCIDSILTQEYDNYKVIICYDDDYCLEYLEQYKNNPKIELFKATEVDKSQKSFYNLYCNQLLNKVENGWIMFLDDDDMFTNCNVLKNINEHLTNDNNLIFWKFKRPDREIYPDIKLLKADTIASCGYCFHSKYKDLSQWIAWQGGDYDYINGLIQKNNFNKNFIDKVLTQTTFDEMKVGNFGQKEPYPKKKYSIIMAYYNRKEQTILTLNQFERLYANKYNFEVVIVDDCSDENEKLSDIVNNYSFKIKYIELENKTWINPVVPLNIAISNISHDVDTVIFQNPETFHCNNILDHAKNIKEDEYFVYPVFNSPSYEENENLKQLFEKNTTNYYYDFIKKIDYKKYRGEWENRVIDVWKGWLQHKDFNDRQLHFLTAIHKSKLDKIGGFCNEMKDGLWYDDDEFLTRIKRVTNCISIESNELIGIHQKHCGGSNENMKKQNAHELRKQNYNIFIKNKDNNNVIYCDPKIDLNYDIHKNFNYLYNNKNESIKIKMNLKKNLKNITTISDFYNKIVPLYSNVWIQYYSIPYYISLFQRPQHICNNMSKFDFLTIYLEESSENTNEIEYLQDHNIWIYRPHCEFNIKRISCPDFQKVYLSIYSTISAYVFKDIYKNIDNSNKNVFLVYEYIDDIDEKICGSKSSTRIQFENKDFAFKKFDILIASSNKLFNELPKDKKCILVNNGCDINHYYSKMNKEYIETEFKNKYNLLCNFKNKYNTVLGYFGAIAPWLDYNMINDITNQRRDIGFVFIGPDYLDQMKNIKIKKNILILGPVDYRVLPYFGYKFDACIIPFEDGDIAKTTSPLKLYEYFSMRKPVICSKYMLECTQYDEILSYDSVKSFSDCIDKSITLMTDRNYLDKLFNIASENTWSKLCEKMIKQLK